MKLNIPVKLKNISNTSDRLFTIDFILILMLAIINSTNAQALNASLPVFTRSLGANNMVAGLVVSVYMIMSISTRPFWGYLSDLRSRKIVVIIGTVIVASAVFGYRFAYSVPLLLVFRAFQGIGFSANTNTTATMAADVIPKKRLSEGIGYYGLVNVAATAFGPPVGIYIVENYSFQKLFEVLGMVSLFCVAAAYLIRYERSLPPKPVDRPRPKFALYEKTALPIATVLLFIALGGGALNSFIPLIAIDRGIKNYSIYFTVFACSLLVTRLTVGKVCDKYGPAKVLYPSLACIACAFAVFAFAYNLPLLLLAGVFYGLGFGTILPALNVLMIRSCPPEKRGSGSSTFYMAMDAGNAVGASVAGVISQYFGFTILYLICELYVSAAILLLARYLKARNKGQLTICHI